MFGFLNRWPSINLLHNLDNVIKSVVWEFKWSPKEIDELYIDDIDHHGLIYWYNHAVEMEKKHNKKNGGKY